MAPAATDFAVEILKVAPGTTLGPLDLVTVTDRTSIEDIGTINRAVDRDLLNFKTGDVTLGFWNADGFMTDLFALFGVTDRWQLRIFRRGAIQFWGVIIGQGSIHFDKKEKTCEITAYGLTRMLNDVSAESVKRGEFSGLTVTTATAGASTLTMSSTALLLTGDVMHLIDTAQAKNEDVTVKLVTSATVVSLAAALVNTYAGGSPITVETPFYRYKTIRFLVEELLEAAGVPLADYRMSKSQFRNIGPVPLAHGGLSSTKTIISGGCERIVSSQKRNYAILDTLGVYYQPVDSPDADWVLEDATLRPWIDWSRYRTQVQGPPAVILRAPDAVGVAASEAFALAVDDRTATRMIYRFNAATSALESNTTTDGTTWTGWVNVVALAGDTVDTGCEFDPVRNLVYVTSGVSGTGTWRAVVRDIGGASTTVLSAADPSGPGYHGFRYIPEKDYVLALYGSWLTLGAFSPTGFPGAACQIAALRGTSVLWTRALPAANHIGSNAGAFAGADRAAAGSTLLGNTFCSMHGARYINGTIYFVAYINGKATLVWSADEFVTVNYKSLGGASSSLASFHPARVADAYYAWTYTTANQANAADKLYLVGAPFYAGVIAYADFEGKSCAEALKDLAVLSDALFWVDDSAQAHFVARDLYDPGAVQPLDGDPDAASRRDMDRTEDVIWEESVSYVEVSGGGFSAVSGENDFAASGISLDSALIPNEAFAQALADAFYDFYGRRRAFIEMNVRDPDGTIYQPLDRKTLDGIRYLVYESDHNLAEDEVSLKLLEDA